jgi:hypothetical protein
MRTNGRDELVLDGVADRGGLKPCTDDCGRLGSSSFPPPRDRDGRGQLLPGLEWEFNTEFLSAAALDETGQITG